MLRKVLLTCFIAGAGICCAQDAVTQDTVQTVDKNLENANKTVVPSGTTVLADREAFHPVMYSQYQSGNKMQRNGIVWTGIGGGLVLIYVHKSICNKSVYSFGRKDRTYSIFNNNYKRLSISNNKIEK